MFHLGSTPSKRPKRRVESYRILYAHILHALSLPGHPLRVTEKATHGEQVGLYSLHSRTGTSITINIVPKCEVCPRDHGKVVESLRGRFFVTFKCFTQGQIHIVHAQIDGGGGEEQEVRTSHPGKSQVSVENSNWTQPPPPHPGNLDRKILGLYPTPRRNFQDPCMHVCM